MNYITQKEFILKFNESAKNCQVFLPGDMNEIEDPVNQEQKSTNAIEQRAQHQNIMTIEAREV